MKARPLHFDLCRLLCAFSFVAPHLNGAEISDSVFVNGDIYTVNERQPHAEAIAVKSGRTVFVGSNADAKKYQSEHTRVIDLHGSSVVPGLTDSHCHIFEIGEREMNLNLEVANALTDFSLASKGAHRPKAARYMDHGARLDRNFLEAAAISDAR